MNDYKYSRRNLKFNKHLSFPFIPCHIDEIVCTCCDRFYSRVLDSLVLKLISSPHFLHFKGSHQSPHLLFPWHFLVLAAPFLVGPKTKVYLLGPDSIFSKIYPKLFKSTNISRECKRISTVNRGLICLLTYV